MAQSVSAGNYGLVDLWTAEDLAEFLRKPLSWVYENYRERFPFYRVGQAIRFDPAEIRASLRGQRDDADDASTVTHR
ncbi:helix-turn-helix domain-containing protein [Actinoallomurus sp. NPDC050550]|uniref:helix-turn-helix domain-containing protein n=1 Tax=Actinoallomurus sp. NPDC050550 TaxID=3154937 RepID=UPI0033E9D0E6